MTPKGKIRRTAGRNRNAISLEVLVEEESASTALRPILEKIVQDRDVRCNIRHFTGKPEWGRRIGPHLSVDKNRSPSFRAFVAGVREITASPGRQA